MYIWEGILLIIKNRHMKKLLLICFFSSVSVFAFSQSTSKKQNTMTGNLRTSTSAPAQPAPAQPAQDPALQKQQKEAKLKAEELKRKVLAADTDPAKTSN